MWSGDSRLAGPEAGVGLPGGSGARRRGAFPRDADDTVLPALGGLSLGGGGAGGGRGRRHRGSFGSRGSLESEPGVPRRSFSSQSVGGGGARGEPSGDSSVLSSPGGPAVPGGGGGASAARGGAGIRDAGNIEVDSPNPRLRALVQDGEETRLRVLQSSLAESLPELLVGLGAPPGSHEALQYRLPEAAPGESEQWVTVKDSADVANMFAEFELAAAEPGKVSRKFFIRLGAGGGARLTAAPAGAVVAERKGAGSEREGAGRPITRCPPPPWGVSLSSLPSNCGESSGWGRGHVGRFSRSTGRTGASPWR